MKSHIETVVLLLLCTALVSANGNLTYDDLDAMGVNCPLRDKCGGYTNNLSYMERSCECDRLCTAYNDCCLDAPYRTATSGQPSVRTNVKCLQYGENPQTGVYAISRCSRHWTGSRQVRQKCVGSPDMRDPLTAAPVTDAANSRTYRNLFCAECNNANMESLKTFQIRMDCGGLQLTDDEILAEMVYDQNLRSWGVNRLNRFGNTTQFYVCDIVYDVPQYLNNSIRFCRSNLITTCIPGWSRRVIKESCEAYMAVVYDKSTENSNAYRNPHCAICNNKTVDEITCRTELSSRKRPMSFALLLDVNQSDGDQVGMRRVATPECPSGHKYDPFFKRCRKLVCALPGHVIVDGRCVNGG